MSSANACPPQELLKAFMLLRTIKHNEAMLKDLLERPPREFQKKHHFRGVKELQDDTANVAPD